MEQPPFTQSPKRIRGINPMQSKPTISKAKMPKTPLDLGEWRESPMLAGYYGAPPLLTLTNMDEVFEAMYMLGCVLKTNYTSVYYCQNDRWGFWRSDTKKTDGLRFDVLGRAKAFLNAEILESKMLLSVAPKNFGKRPPFHFRFEKTGTDTDSYIDTYRMVIEGE